MSTDSMIDDMIGMRPDMKDDLEALKTLDFSKPEALEGAMIKQNPENEEEIKEIFKNSNLSHTMKAMFDLSNMF